MKPPKQPGCVSCKQGRTVNCRLQPEEVDTRAEMSNRRLVIVDASCCNSSIHHSSTSSSTNSSNTSSIISSSGSTSRMDRSMGRGSSGEQRSSGPSGTFSCQTTACRATSASSRACTSLRSGRGEALSSILPLCARVSSPAFYWPRNV